MLNKHWSYLGLKENKILRFARTCESKFESAYEEERGQNPQCEDAW